ncbi:nucleotidyl transferase AbiEii/AbiGii toxin family protein [Mucilaginibacter angelicae]|uniref:Nucleotidyl transferase AbiEii/AbiGii toxin family protein n=1 Tax=Mucilaginibacter angelicae TaxID=869718 RepID=A0ABV6L2S6_9SPHI
MSAVSPELIEAIKELQKLPSLKSALLGGGINLAIRYDHRQSVDIDLFFPEIIGREGFEQIKRKLRLNLMEMYMGLTIHAR